MKKMICELCEGSQFVKENDLFVCQSCGTGYTLEAARALMREISDESTPEKPVVAAAQPPVKESEPEKVNYLLTLAENTLAGKDFARAEEYAGKLLEQDCNQPKCWFIKGQAILGQTSTQNHRFKEVLSCWKIAFENAGEDFNSMAQAMKAYTTECLQKCIDSACQTFTLQPNNANANALMSFCHEIVAFCREAKTELNLPIETGKIAQYIAEKLNDSAVAASNRADQSFGTTRAQRTKVAWERWINTSDCCAAVLGYALSMAERIDLLEQIYNNYALIINNTINSCSYRRDQYGNFVQDFSLTKEAKLSRRKMLQEKLTMKNKGLAAVQQKVENSLQAEEAARMEQVNAYWAEHPEEKAMLEGYRDQLLEKKNACADELKALSDRQNNLNAQLAQLQKEKNTPVAAQRAYTDVNREISRLNTQLLGLGMFKGKEKKVLEAEIEQHVQRREMLKAEIQQQQQEKDRSIAERKAVVMDQRDELNTQMLQMKCRMAELEEQLEKAENDLIRK